MLDTPVPQMPQLGLDAERSPAQIARDWLPVERLLLVLLIALIVPLPFLGRTAWADAALPVGAAALLLARAALAAAGIVTDGVPLRRLWPALVPLALGLGWSLLQATPLMPAASRHPLWEM